MNCSVRKRDALRNSEELAELKSQVKQLHSQETLDKQGFQYDAQEPFEPLTETVSDF